jgi:hypothetical protein
VLPLNGNQLIAIEPVYNLALKYTHGYGIVAVPVNEMDERQSTSVGARHSGQGQRRLRGGPWRDLLRCVDERPTGSPRLNSIGNAA